MFCTVKTIGKDSMTASKTVSWRFGITFSQKRCCWRWMKRLSKLDVSSLQTADHAVLGWSVNNWESSRSDSDSFQGFQDGFWLLMDSKIVCQKNNLLWGHTWTFSHNINEGLDGNVPEATALQSWRGFNDKDGQRWVLTPFFMILDRNFKVKVSLSCSAFWKSSGKEPAARQFQKQRQIG
jgi:hypothetical protein